MSNEPVLTAAAVAPILIALIYTLRAFGVPLTDDQQESIITLIATALPLLLAWWARQKVTPVANPKNDEGVPLVPVTEVYNG